MRSSELIAEIVARTGLELATVRAVVAVGLPSAMTKTLIIDEFLPIPKLGIFKRIPQKNRFITNQNINNGAPVKYIKRYKITLDSMRGDR